MPLQIVRNDIARMKVDAIVNAANTELQMGGGVCGAIFRAAGARELQAACDALKPINTGEAVITSAFNLPARYIIHTAGPVYRGGQHGEAGLLQACYLNSLKLAQQYECESVAFPLISSGLFGYPKGEALAIAMSAIRGFLLDNDLTVYLVVFDKAAFALSQELLGEVSAYVDQHYVDRHIDMRRRRQLLDAEMVALKEAPAEDVVFSRVMGVDELIGRLDESFSETLLRLIDAKGMTDVEVYKGANLDRRLFSKIRSNQGYRPSKKTAIALAIALELDLEETNDLLERAGYALSRSQKFDVIIEYFISNGKYDIFEINEVLFYYDQPLLGG
ncbi:MAG: macro domain-containing protein [Bacillota bacterium]|jgi:O-acetyl-ADP-ribose deacetylase (regulator of RNase III)